MPEKFHQSQHFQNSMGEESPRLSTDSSVSGYDPVLADCCSMEHSENERPVSAVSTLSSDSSKEGQYSPYNASHAGPVPSSLAGTDINLELSPPEAPEEPSNLSNPRSKRFKQDSSEGQFDNTTEVIVVPSSQDEESSVSSVMMAPNSQLTYVDRVVMEIIETERMYVRDLHSIVKDYLAHIIDSRFLPIKPEQVSSLFGNIEVIYEFNSELLQSLEMCDNNPVAIAFCFVNKSEDFNIYTQYCTNYPNSVKTLTECMRNKTLAKFFRDRQASLQRSLPLGAYLLKPVQRILKYHLLLQELAKHFHPEEEGFDMVEEAIDTMTGVAWYINDMKRKHEHAVRLQEIQSLLINWKGPDLTTYGELVLEGTFHLHHAKNERTLFLFEKVLLITKKRGEHYVYKAHIMCSTLMLIESAKDSLRFSVTHYKHPKQPHTVQTKTVEEKKLWAHHIKRLILENHQAIIPQKAKDAMLDMTSFLTGPVKYRYSPEKLNKVASCQREDFQSKGRTGRRQSEPLNRIKQGLKIAAETLKHADSEGVLLSESSQSSLQASASVSTLSLSHDEADMEVLAAEQNRTERFNLRTNSLDRLSMTELEACHSDMMFQKEKEEVTERAIEEVHGENFKVEDDEILMKNEQNRDEDEASEENETMEPEKGPPPSTEDQDDLSDSSVDCRSQHISFSGDTEEASEYQWNVKEEGGEGEDILENGVDLLSQSQNEIPQETEMTSSSLNISDDAAELDEDDVEEEEQVLSKAESNSILQSQSSVLDTDSVIADQLGSSLYQRSSLVADDIFTQDCPSSQTASRRSSACSLNAELMEKENFEELNRSIVEALPQKLETETLLANSLGERLATPNQKPQTKTDTLSKKDRMLIHKIKQYYEHAEDQDVNFSIKRRESLSYIPAGLVRNLSQQLNAHPTGEDEAQHGKASAITRPTSWEVFDLPGLKMEQEKLKEITNCDDLSINNLDSTNGTCGIDVSHGGDVNFHSSSEMDADWKDMEDKISGTFKDLDDAFTDNENDHFNFTCTNQIQKEQECLISNFGKPLHVLKDSGHSKQEPLTAVSTSSVQTSQQELDSIPNSDQTHTLASRIKNVPLPRIIIPKSGPEDVLQDMEKMKNKVFSLARQYSQRIKRNRPIVKQRALDVESHFNLKELSSDGENKATVNGMGFRPQNLSTSHGFFEHIDSSPSLSPCSLGDPVPVQSTLRPPDQNPQSPVNTESFQWPDVRELRSKYSRHNSEPQLISRCFSVPDQILDAGCSPASQINYSYSIPDTESMSPHTISAMDNRIHNKGLEPGLCDAAQLCKTSSLDHILGPLDLKVHYISAQASLPNDKKVIVVERIAQATAEKNSLTATEEKKETIEGSRLKRQDSETIEDSRLKRQDSEGPCLSGSVKKTDNQHSLVKNLREKFQNLSSYT